MCPYRETRSHPVLPLLSSQFRRSVPRPAPCVRGLSSHLFFRNNLGPLYRSDRRKSAKAARIRRYEWFRVGDMPAYVQFDDILLTFDENLKFDGLA
jgi:hypothetical protein